MRQVRPGAVDAEQVREPRNGDAEVGGRLVTPLLAQGRPPRPVTSIDVRGRCAGSRSRADDVDGVERPDRDDAVGLDAIDPVPHELDVRALERPEPRAVVLQHPLAERRVVRDDLVDEVRSLSDDRCHPAQQPSSASRGLHSPNGRSGRRGPGRSGTARCRRRCPRTSSGSGTSVRRTAGAAAPSGHRVEPAWYSGFGMIHWAVRWKTVRWSTRSAIGADLEAGRPGADQAEPGTGDVEVIGPASRGNDRPAKVSRPGMSGSFGMFSEPTALMRNRASSTSSPCGAATHPPPGGVLLPRHLRDGRPEAAVRPQVVLVDDPREVVAQLGLPAELAPVVSGLERVAVPVAADVDLHPGSGSPTRCRPGPRSCR